MTSSSVSSQSLRRLPRTTRSLRKIAKTEPRWFQRTRRSQSERFLELGYERGSRVVARKHPMYAAKLQIRDCRFSGMPVSVRTCLDRLYNIAPLGAHRKFGDRHEKNPQ